MITKTLVRELFEYRDGDLYWRVARNQNKKVGDKAGHLQSNGYRVTSITTADTKNLYKNHRLIFLYFHGFIPAYIDHIDGNPLNNRVENLREATYQENNRNAATRKDNSSGHKNVSWDGESKKWRVRINTDKGMKYFGRYNDIDYAVFVADAMRSKYHGNFARTK